MGRTNYSFEKQQKDMAKKKKKADKLQRKTERSETPSMDGAGSEAGVETPATDANAKPNADSDTQESADR